MILIDTEVNGINYYINKLPVYTFSGKLYKSYMCNYNNKNLNLLNISKDFSDLFRTKDYFNVLNTKRKYSNDQVVNDININALIILYYYIHCIYVDRYDISIDLLNKFKTINRSTINLFYAKKPVIDEHNTNPLDDIYKINFKINDKLYLNEKGYDYNKMSKYNPNYTYNKLINTNLCVYYKYRLLPPQNYRYYID